MSLCQATLAAKNKCLAQSNKSRTRGKATKNSKWSNERATDTRSRTADRAIASLRKAIEELAAERPREARAMVVNAAGSLAALREMIEGQILKQPGMVK